MGTLARHVAVAIAGAAIAIAGLPVAEAAPKCTDVGPTVTFTVSLVVALPLVAVSW